MLLRIAVLSILVTGLNTSAMADEARDNTTETRRRYYCPPCGCCSDETVVYYKGQCSSCSMELIEVNPGIKGQTAGLLADLFRQTNVSNAYFDRLMYPAFFLGIVVSLLLMFRSPGNHANWYLALLTLTLSLYPFQNRLCDLAGQLLNANVNLLFFPVSFIPFLGPLALFYSRSQVNADVRFRRADIWHFLPGIGGFILYLSLFLKSPSVRRDIIFSPDVLAFSHLEQVIAIVLGFIYVGIAQHHLRESIRGQNCTPGQAWARKMNAALVLLLILWSSILLIDLQLYSFRISNMTYYPLWTGIALFIYWLAYQCFFEQKFVFKGGGNGATTNTRNLPDFFIERHRNSLVHLMETEHLYLDPSLTLSKLAEQLGIKPKDLTVVLKHGLQTSFYDFINEYRIKAAKQKLLSSENRHLTILAIAYDSGFNSKSSFNQLFKKHVLMTPKDFKNKFGRNATT